MSADALFYKVPTAIIEAEGMDGLLGIIDAQDEFTTFDGSGYAFAGLLAHLDSLQSLPRVAPEIEQIAASLVDEFDYMACIPITHERAVHYQMVLSSATWSLSSALECFAGTAGSPGDEVDEDFSSAMEVLNEALNGADTEHLVLILFV